jgi:hypothetical protein
MARVLQPIEIAGVKYRVLRLNGSRGPRYLLRSESGELLGLYPYGAEPTRFYAAPLKPARDTANPFARFDFFDVGDKLIRSRWSEGCSLSLVACSTWSVSFIYLRDIRIG